MAITRFKNSSIANNTPKYDQMLAGLPYIPTIGTATDGGTGTTVSVAFTGNNVANGTITYTALSNPGSLTGTGTASPITISGLTAGTAYTFQVKAGNSLGDSAYSAASNSVTPVTPTAFDSIATFTGNNTSSTVTFSSIPSTYKSLQIRINSMDGGASGGFAINMTLNNDTGANYTLHRVQGNGSAASATGGTGNSSASTIANAGGGAASTPAPAIIDLIDYASTSKNKTIRSFSGFDRNSAGLIRLYSSLWLSTAAVNRIDLTGTNNFDTGTTIALYGIKG